MKHFRLLITPHTWVTKTQNDSVLFRIPEKCPYTLKEGNTITVVRPGKPHFKASILELGKSSAKVQAGNFQYRVPHNHILACDGVSCKGKHQLSDVSRRRLKRLQKYNEYKAELLTEARRVGFDLPEAGAFIVFYRPISSRYNKKHKAAHHMRWHQQTPDLSNFIKAFEDGLLKQDKGIAFYSGLAKVWVDSRHGWIEVHVPESEEDMIKIARLQWNMMQDCEHEVKWNKLAEEINEHE